MKLFRMSLTVAFAGLAASGCSSSDDPTGPGPSNSVVVVSGSGQTGVIGVQLSTPLTVSVQNSTGTGLAGQTVTWAVTDSAGPGATLSLSSTTTGTDGKTGVAFTLGSVEGGYAVTASISGSSDVFTATAVASLPPSLVSESGDGQVGFAAAVLSQPLDVRVVDSFGNPVSGETVSFAITSGAGAQIDASAVSDPFGVASAMMTLGPTNGAYGAQAVLGSEIVPFSANACGGDAGAAVLNLAPGQDTLLAGSEFNCVQLPAHAAGEEYELVATMAPDGFVPTPFRIAVNGRGPVTSIRADAAPVRPWQASIVAPGQELLDGTLRRMGVQYAWDMQLRRLERELAGLPKAEPGFQLFAVPPTVGDQRTFGASCTTEPDVTAKVVSVGTQGVIYEDLANGGAFFTTAQYDSIMAEFDNLVYATNVNYFGAPLDFDGNERVIMLVTTAVNALTTGDYADGFVSGYFCPLDVVSGLGNDGEMFYLVAPDPNGEFNGGGGTLPAATVRQFMINVIAHEFQHLVNNQTGPPFPIGGASEIWVNEGMSHLAEEVNGHTETGLTPGANLSAIDMINGTGSSAVFNKWYTPQFTNLGAYLANPTDSATLVQQQDPAQNGDGLGSFRMRGVNWAFLRYLLDRYAMPGTEAQTTKQLLASTGGSRAALASLFGQPFEDLVSDFNSMLAAEGRTDFVGPVAPEFDMKSYQLRDIMDGLFVEPQWKLMPRVTNLGFSTTHVSELYPGSSQFMTLVAGAATGGTGVRFSLGDGTDIGADRRARMRIIRVK